MAVLFDVVAALSEAVRWPYASVVCVLVLVGLATQLRGLFSTRPRDEDIPPREKPYELPVPEPLVDFDWAATRPVQNRPFKPVYHLTMGIQNGDLNAIIDMDRTYLGRIEARSAIIRDHGDRVIGCQDGAEDAVFELYEYLVATYLPARYPSMFRLDNKAGQLHNLVNGAVLPLRTPADPREALQILGVNIDQDYLFMLPSNDGDGYTLKAMLWCYPVGFDPLDKFGRKLRDVHEGVPHYRERLESSMDRFMSRMTTGKMVVRANWSIATNDNLYEVGEFHLLPGQVPKPDPVDLTQTFVRSEKQKLFKLPKSGAVLFGIENYQYPIRDIKEEGSGPDLARAIEGLAKGNAPEMHRYKRAPVWSEKILKYLSDDTKIQEREHN